MRPVLKPTRTTHPDRQIECEEAIAAAFHEAMLCCRRFTSLPLGVGEIRAWASHGYWLNAGDAVEAAQLLHDSLEARGQFGGHDQRNRRPPARD